MDIRAFMSALLQFFVLFPSAASCYLPAKNHMKYTQLRTTALYSVLLLLYSFLGAWLHTAFLISVNSMLLFGIVLFFLPYHSTLKTDLPRSLAIYIGVCAVQTFPGQFAYALDSHLYPMSNANNLSPEAALFQLVFACMMPAIASYTASRHYIWAVDHLDIPKFWYSTIGLSSIFLILNVAAVPHSYTILHTGRMPFLFPILEACALMFLITLYALFYQSARLIMEHAELKEHAQLLEMQAHQYHTLQEYMKQTARLRHDFRHHLRLLASLAEKDDIDSIRAHLAQYELRLEENAPANYCANAALNALFGYYHEMAAAASIKTDWNIELPHPLTISELDLASLFGNLMENAIAGCLNIPEENRYFGLTSEIRHENRLYVVSTNSFDGHIRKGKDGYRSTKHSGKGTGLVSIFAVAEKYHGLAQAYNSDSEFFVDVELKI